MRIVTFNIQHGQAGDGRTDTVALAEWCASLDAEVLALQEVDVGVRRSGRADQAAVVAHATGLTYVFGEACRVGLTGRYGNALLTRPAPHDIEVVRLPRLGRRERRSAIMARVGGVTVAVTHLSVHGAESQQQLEATTAALLARPGPHVLAGDLNRRPEDLEPTLAPAGLVLADSSAATFPAVAPVARIDHVAVAGVTIRSVKVLPAAPVSDHRAVLVEVS